MTLHPFSRNVEVNRAAEINALLVGGGIGVSELAIRNAGFEDYFIERLGK